MNESSTGRVTSGESCRRLPALSLLGLCLFASNTWAQQAGTAPTLEAVVVTAQKVKQREIDVPVAVTAISGGTLVNQDLVQISDYYSRIPGLQVGALPSNANGISALSLRGITSGGAGNPTIGVMIDDIPFGASTFNGQPPFPDLDPAILKQVEVLRGPQGTLYGASSLGGLIDLVTKTPDLRKYSADVQLGESSVSGGDTGATGRGSANIPLIHDRVALLVSGVYRKDPAWIDNEFNNTRNVNQIITRGGLAKLLIRPTDRLSVTLSAIAQHQTSVNGIVGIMVCPQCATNPSSPVNYTPVYGNNTIDLSPSPGFNTFEVYSARINYDLGWATLTSLSAWNHTQWLNVQDVTFVFGFLPPLYGLSGGRVTINNVNQSSRFTQEVRLQHSGKHFDWLAGFYFNHEQENVIQALDLFTSSGSPAGVPYNGAGPFYYFERALFGDLTWHITPKLDLQVGGRYSSLDEEYYTATTITGNASLVFGPTSITPKGLASAHPVTWLVTPSYHITPNLMAYFRAATGYRPGGPNTPLPGIPSTFAPDKVYSYELGVKGAPRGKNFSFDASIFDIEWKNIQLLDTDPVSQFTYFSNGSAARSQGLELAGGWRPWRGFTVNPTFTYTDARLSQNLPGPSATVTPLAGVSGDELPFTAKFTADLGVQQSFPLTSSLSGYVGADYSYVGRRMSAFRTNSPSAPGPRFALPGYGLLELQAGLYWNEWRLNLYGRNLGNVLGVISATNRGGTAQPVADFVQPRTIGLDVEYNFEHR